jgi:hypothetical protein
MGLLRQKLVDKFARSLADDPHVMALAIEFCDLGKEFSFARRRTFAIHQVVEYVAFKNKRIGFHTLAP